jgi:hypothetical protein
MEAQGFVYSDELTKKVRDKVAQDNKKRMYLVSEMEEGQVVLFDVVVLICIDVAPFLFMQVPSTLL